MTDVIGEIQRVGMILALAVCVFGGINCMLLLYLIGEVGDIKRARKD